VVARCATAVFIAVCGLVASAAEPTLTHIFPAAGTRGTNVTVRPSGKFAPWPVQAWVDAPGIVFKALPKAGEFDVEIAPDAAPGPHLIRLFNGEGASAPRFFIVSAAPETLEAEPNDDFKKPQKIAALPTTISGQLGKAGDVDSFAVSLKKGETLTARVEAYVLGSTFDGMLRLVDESGTQLAFNHDDGRTPDPRLTWTATSDGTFTVQLMGFAYPANSAVGFTGGEGCIYRLHLTTKPQPRISLPSHDPSRGAAIAEQEPNDTGSNAQAINFPCSIPGVIEKAGDQDRFAFTAVKAMAYELKLFGARAGSPLDAWLKIENKDGKELAHNDDAEGSRDPQLTWTAPGDGVFVAAIGDLTHRGGRDYIYRLTISEAKPSVNATAASHSVVVTAGKTSEIKATVKRVNGLKLKLQLTAKNLPEGLSAADVDVPDKGGEVTLKITATDTATAASQPFQLVVRESESGTEHVVPYFMTTSGENNGVPQGYTELVINSTDQLWLTVIGAPPKPQAPAAAEEPLFVARPLTTEGAFTPGIEGPACDAAGNLYVVNFGSEHSIGRVTPDGKAELFVTLPEGSTGNGIRFGRDGVMYVADYTGHNVLRVEMKTKAISVFAHEPKMNQPNDLAITADGTLYASDPNWKDKTGQLWRIDREGRTHLLASGLGTTNGIDVSPDGQTLYVNESEQRGVWAFPIKADGSLGPRKLVKQFDDFGFDGMRCDVDGNLYVTRHFKGSVVKLSPTGEILREIDVLGSKPSNICFGGPDGRTAYVTEVEHTRVVQFRVDRPALEWQRWQKK